MYRKHGLQSVRFPPCSGDLNPIETVWARLRRDLSIREMEDLRVGKHVTAAQYRQRVAQLLNSYAVPAPGQTLSFCCRSSSRACHAAWQNAGRTNMGPVDIEARPTSTPSHWQAVKSCSVAVLALKILALFVRNFLTTPGGISSRQKDEGQISFCFLFQCFIVFSRAWFSHSSSCTLSVCHLLLVYSPSTLLLLTSLPLSLVCFVHFSSFGHVLILYLGSPPRTPVDS